jgi:hypothetical protein
MNFGVKNYRFNCVKISQDVDLSSDGSRAGLKLGCSYYHLSQEGSIFPYCKRTCMPCVVQLVLNGVRSLEDFVKEVGAKKVA